MADAWPFNSGRVGRAFFLAGHVEPPLNGDGVTETYVSKGRTALKLRRNEKAFDVWFPACHACQEKFNCCPGAPTWIVEKLFGRFQGSAVSYLQTGAWLWLA